MIKITEAMWRAMTESQRIHAKLWSKKDRLSVDRALWGTSDFTIKIKHTFGEKMVPKPSTQDDVHCHVVVNRRGKHLSVAEAMRLKPLPPRK